MLDRSPHRGAPRAQTCALRALPTCSESGRMVLAVELGKAYGNLVVLNGVNLHLERGDRIALVPRTAPASRADALLPRGAVVTPQGQGRHAVSHEATRLDSAKTSTRPCRADSPIEHRCPQHPGGFLFAGDDISAGRARVASGPAGGSAAMLPRPVNPAPRRADQPPRPRSKDAPRGAEDFGTYLRLARPYPSTGWHQVRAVGRHEVYRAPQRSSGAAPSAPAHRLDAANRPPSARRPDGARERPACR